MKKLKQTIPTINRIAQQFLDRKFVQDTGLPSLILMEQAARGLTEQIRDHAGNEKKLIVFLVGAGNNAGDAFASARQLLSDPYQIKIVELFPEKQYSTDAAANKAAYLALNGEINQWQELDPAEIDIIVDGILGTGFSLQRPLSDELAALIDQVNHLPNVLRIAIDIPTGIESDTGACDRIVFQAHQTVTFSTPKIGLIADPGNRYAGEIKIEPISMSESWLRRSLKCLEQEQQISLPEILTERTFIDLEKPRHVLSHKGNFGKGLLLGGSAGMQGALLLALRAVHATGIGYAYVRSDETALYDLLREYPNSLIDLLPKEQKTWSNLLETVDAVAIGPGIGKANWISEILSVLFQQAERLIIDADALNVLATVENWQSYGQERAELGLQPAILTPHPGEFARIAPDLKSLLKKDRQTAAAILAKRSQCIIVLKGHVTVIALPDGKVYLNSTGNPGLAKAGSGDVLTGLILGFAAQYPEAEKAASLGVFFHGLLADLAAEDKGIRNVLPQHLTDYAQKAYMLLNWQD